MRHLAAVRRVVAGLSACLLLLFACLGCFGQEEQTIDLVYPNGVQIVSLTSGTIPVGGSTTMTVRYYATTSEEVGRTVRASAYFTQNNVTHELAHQDVILGAVNESRNVQFQIAFPQGTNVGTYTVYATRAAGNPNVNIVPDSRPITIAAEGGVNLSFNPTTVAAVRGTFGSTVLTVTPTNGFVGTVTLAPRVPELTLSQNSVTFTAGNQAPVQVVATYTVPINAIGDGTVAVIDYIVQGRPIASTSFAVTYTIPQATEFDIQVEPATVRIQGQQVMDTVRVTIHALNGWRGDVEVTMDLPGNGSLINDLPTTPHVVTVDTDSVTVDFFLRYIPGQGTAPIGTATVRGTSGGVGHEDTFQVTAS
jgi:hypothetical protein